MIHFSCTRFLVILNYLLTLSLWQEDTFGPLGLTFMRDNDFGAMGLEADEMFDLFYATG